MFPIANESGRVIAFTARTLDSGDKAGPKYVNSPETPLYSKGQVLFNLDKAKTAIRQAGYALLVEGQMDCISVYLRGIRHVIATSGTAFTEQQIAILKRHTSNVVVNFDPDAAGANAAEKSIALLTEEGFSIKIATLEGGLDPDRFVREQGGTAYSEATYRGDQRVYNLASGAFDWNAYIEGIRGAQWHADFLIDRAKRLFPGSTADQKVKAMNFLLPHIRRIPEKLVRDQFAHEAAQKLGIDSSVLREELRQAALRRRDHIEVRATALTEIERVVLRALAITDPEHESARRLAIDAVSQQPELFESLGALPAIQALAARGALDPMDAVDDQAQRALLAESLLAETEPPSSSAVEGAVASLKQRQLEAALRDLRVQIAESERRGDFTELALLTQHKLDLDRGLRKLQIRKPSTE
jgi:DNA primase